MAKDPVDAKRALNLNQSHRQIRPSWMPAQSKMVIVCLAVTANLDTAVVSFLHAALQIIKQDEVQCFYSSKFDCLYNLYRFFLVVDRNKLLKLTISLDSIAEGATAWLKVGF
jgi:hypothetical protein